MTETYVQPPLSSIPDLFPIRSLVVVIVNRLVRTPTRRTVQVVSEIDIQLLPRAHIPRTQIRPRHPGYAPLQIIASPLERPIRVLLSAPRHRQTKIVQLPRLAHDCVQQLRRLPWPADELHELPVDDLQLSGRGVVAEDGGSSRVQGFGLHVFVIIGRCYGPNPIVTGL